MDIIIQRFSLSTCNRLLQWCMYVLTNYTIVSRNKNTTFKFQLSRILWRADYLGKSDPIIDINYGEALATSEVMSSVLVVIETTEILFTHSLL